MSAHRKSPKSMETLRSLLAAMVVVAIIGSGFVFQQLAVNPELSVRTIIATNVQSLLDMLTGRDNNPKSLPMPSRPAKRPVAQKPAVKAATGPAQPGPFDAESLQGNRRMPLKTTNANVVVDTK
jgi:hypothetical protein